MTMTVDAPITTTTQQGPGFTVPFTELVSALDALVVAVPTRAHVPALGGVLVTRDWTGVRLSTFDYETSVTVELDGVPGGEPSTVLVAMHELRKVVKAASKGETARTTASWMVSLTSDAREFSSAELTVDGFTVPLGTLKASDYPTIPAPAETVLTVDRDRLLEQLLHAQVAAGTDETLPMLTGVHCAVYHGALTLACTDRFRLDATSVPVTGEHTGEWLLRVKSLVALVKAMQSGTLELGMTDTAWTLRAGTITATQRVMDNEFPKWRQLMRTEHSTTVSVDRAALVKATAKAIAMGTALTDASQYLRVSASGEQLTVSPYFHDQEQQARVRGQVLAATVDGPELVFGFTGTYLLDALKSFTGDTVHLGLLTHSRPVMLAESVGELTHLDADHRHLVMTAKLVENTI